MAPERVHLLRHAQGFHNLTPLNHSMHDPLLTELGKSQCETVERTFPNPSSLNLIVASPLKRTIYTALYSFKSIIAEKKMTIVALPEVQETSDLPCDTGSSIEELRREFAGQPVDLSLVEQAGPEWNSKKGKWKPSEAAVAARAAEARKWLAARPEENIVVTTHGGFLHYLTEDWHGFEKFNGTGWANCEFREYALVVDEDIGKPALKETVVSRNRRRGSEQPLTEAEQRNLRETAVKSWEESGYTKNEEPIIEAKI